LYVCTIVLTGRPAALDDLSNVDWAPSCVLRPLSVPETSTVSPPRKRKMAADSEDACMSVQDAAIQCDLITTSSVGTQCLIQPHTADKSISFFFFLDTGSGENVSFLQFLTICWATTWNCSMKFHYFIACSYLHMSARWYLITGCTIASVLL